MVLLLLPGVEVAAAAAPGVDRAAAARPGHRAEERIPALVGPVHPVEAAEPEMTEATLQEMRGHQDGDRRVVDVGQGQAGAADHAEDVDGRDARGRDRVGDPGILEPGDDPVAVPAEEPGGDGLAEAPGLEVN